jgi:hypothetical protein
MVELAVASINSFASPAPAADIIQALLAELSALREEVAQLRDDNQCLQDRIASLERLERLYHGPAPEPEDIPPLQEAYKRQREAQASLPGQVFELQQDLRAMEMAVHNRPAVRGEKTRKRLQKLDGLLLASPEPMSYSDVGKRLELGSRSPDGKSTRRQAMTKLGKILELQPDRYIIRKARRGNARYVSLVPEYRAHLKRKTSEV